MVIEHKDHIIYPTTFLQNVVVSMRYLPGHYSPEDEKEIIAESNSFFLENFGIDFQVDSLGRQFNLTNEEDDMGYVFTPNSAMVRVGRKHYTSFDASVMPNIYRLRNFVFKVLKQNMIDALQVRKLNMFPVQIEGPVNEDVFRNMENYLLSSDLLQIDKTPYQVLQIENAVTGVYKREIEDGNNLFSIVTSTTRRGEDNTYNLVLDISCRTSDSSEGITEEKVEERLTELNQRLFDLYHWSVSNEVTDVMTQPK